LTSHWSLFNSSQLRKNPAAFIVSVLFCIEDRSMSNIKQIANHMRMAAVAGLLIVLASPSVYTQEVPKTDVSFGYHWQRVSRCGGTTLCKDSLPAGWYLDASGGISGMFGWVGLLDGSYQSGAFGFNSGVSNFNIYTYGGGVRVTATSIVSPFAQFLVGGIRRELTILGSTAPVRAAFMIDIGGGVNIPAGRRWGTRIGGDYRRGFFEELDLGPMNLGSMNNVRVNLGVVVSLD
jgi:hypothetical protein